MIDTEKYKKLLLNELTKLRLQLEGVAEQNTEGSDDWRAKVGDKSINEADPLEVADEMEGLIEANAITEELEQRFREIKLALRKIEDGTYGKDEVDGTDIPEDRLMVNPAARSKVENSHLLGPIE